MTIGHFAGGFADAFFKVASARQDKKEQDKIAKLQGQLLELKIKREQQGLSATQKIADMSTGTLGGFDIGQTTESGGLKQTPIEFQGKNPMSLSEILADPEGQFAALQAGLVSPGSLGGGDKPADLKLLEAAGIDPQSEEGREAILSAVGGSGQNQLMDQLKAQIELFKLDDMRRQRAADEKTHQQRVAGTKVSVRNDFHHAQEMIEIQRELENTALQSGIPFGEFMTLLQAGGAAVAGALGFDVSKTRELIAKRQRLEKLFADGVIESIDRFAESGTVTRDKFQALIKASPDISKSPQTNAKVLADRMQAALDAAEIEGITIPEREEIEAFIEQARNFSLAEQETVVDVPGAAGAAADAGRAVVAEAKDVAKMSLEQLQRLDLGKLSDEALEAARKRWDALNGGR